MSEVTVRQVTLEDFDRVMDINRDVYEGKDYLPVKYHQFFHQNNWRVYALEQNQLLVSFVLFMLSGEGEVVSTMAVRVRPTHQGLGLSVDKNAQLRGALRADVPSVKRELYATLRHEGTEKKIQNSVMHYQWNIIGRRLVLHRDLPSAMFDISNPQVIRLSYTDVLRSLENSDKIPRFLSQYANEYVPAELYWLPTKIETNQLKRLFAVTNTLITLSNTSSKDTAQTSIHQGEIKALSYCSTCPVPLGCKTDLFYFGSLEDFKGHLVEHLKYEAGVYDGLTCLHVHLPHSIDPQELIENLKGTHLLEAEVLSNSERMSCVMCSKDF